jgi:hypothetical protein
VIVPVRHPVKAARAVAKLYLRNMTRVFQVSQAVINRRERNAWQKLFCAGKNLIRRHMAFRIADNLQHNLTLLR